MEKPHLTCMTEDTIAAVATPLGEAGIAIIRLSGPEAVILTDGLFRMPGGRKQLRDQASHTIHYGHIWYGGERLDEVMVALMRAPKSYTREDVVEINCHGGLMTTRKVLDAVLRSGARLAEPGEFTRRAFINGRIDLTQAEAVADLIHARSERAMAMAGEQLQGSLSRKVNLVRDDLMNVLAHMEAHIDFPDEDIAPDTLDSLRAKLDSGIQFMSHLLSTAGDGRLMRQGIRTAIVGRPNAGKSSLLNQLLGEDRAIVSAIAGTTRDTIEEFASINGIPVIFIDTAGLRETTDEVEQEGIRRSLASLEKADLILHILDVSEDLHEADRDFASRFSGKRKITVANKSDLGVVADLGSLEPLVQISCARGHGIDDLKQAIEKMFWERPGDSSQDQLMINSRHESQLHRAHEATQKARLAIDDDWSLEVVAMELRIAVQAIGEIVGKTSTEDLLDKIFSQFCLGK